MSESKVTDGDAAGSHYDVLGLARDASVTEVQKAYRQLALELHPDRVSGSEAHKTACVAKFKRASEAYEVLRDAAKRSAYDKELQGM